MRALTIAASASLVVNAIAIVWLRPTAAAAAGMVAPNDDSDVSRADPDPDDEMVVELVDERGASSSPVVGVASPGPTVRVPDARDPLDSTVRVPDARHPSDSWEHASHSQVALPNSAVRASDSTVRASDSAVRASDSATGGSGGSATTGDGTYLRTLDAILAPADAATGGEAPQPGAHAKMMTMRGTNLALPTDAVDAILSRPRATETSATRGGGTHETAEAPEPPDEAAELRHEITELDKRLMGPDLATYASADEIDGLREDLASKKRDLAQMTIYPTGGGRYGATHKTYTASIGPDGTAHLEDRPNFQWESIFKATFDVTDWAMRSDGDDPYARAKMRFLDRTRPERVAIGMRDRAEELARAPQRMQANVERAWATIVDPAARKQALFELWDDCAETGEPAVVDAGAAARALVLGVIRARVSYTPAELARLNARRHSAARFEP